jgi:hypothetical protein
VSLVRSWHREAICESLGYITGQLADLRFPKIRRIYESSPLEFVVGPFIDKNGESFGPFDTAVEYHQYKARKIRGRFHKWLASKRPLHTPEDIERANELCRLYDSVAGQLSDFDNASFPIIHGNLGLDSLLYPLDESDLFAVIHWDKAHTGPWLEFAQYPAFSRIEWPKLKHGEYDDEDLEQIQYRQHKYLHEFARGRSDDVAWRVEERLSEVIDCPGVRVSEFFVRFGKPRAGVDVQMFLKYVKDWKPDWEEFEPMQIENGE